MMCGHRDAIGSARLCQAIPPSWKTTVEQRMDIFKLVVSKPSTSCCFHSEFTLALQCFCSCAGQPWNTIVLPSFEHKKKTWYPWMCTNKTKQILFEASCFYKVLINSANLLTERSRTEQQASGREAKKITKMGSKSVQSNNILYENRIKESVCKFHKHLGPMKLFLTLLHLKIKRGEGICGQQSSPNWHGYDADQEHGKDDDNVSTRHAVSIHPLVGVNSIEQLSILKITLKETNRWMRPPLWGFIRSKKKCQFSAIWAGKASRSVGEVVFVGRILCKNE